MNRTFPSAQGNQHRIKNILAGDPKHHFWLSHTKSYLLSIIARYDLHMNEPLVENQRRLFPLRVASGLSLLLPRPLLPRPLRLRGAGGRRYSFREAGGGRTRLERSSLDGSVLGRILGRLGGHINSLSIELTD